MTKAKDNEQKYSDSLEDLEVTHLMCRAKGHYWVHVNDKVLAWFRGEPKQIERDWKCGRCTTGMLEELHIPSFDLIKRKYYYVDGYLLSKKATDGIRVNIRDIREEQLVRSGLVKRGRRTQAKGSRLRVVG